MGYGRAGFRVIGVDINPQPNYPSEFYRGDALSVTQWGAFDAVHASPPCQRYSTLSALAPHVEYPDLIAPTRDMLDATGLPYVIENVMTAPLKRERSIVLCGEMFGLRTYRHRRFELSGFGVEAPAHPRHVIPTATSRRRERWRQGWHVSITGDVGTYLGREAMGITWMTGQEMCEAIPPAYTEYIGGYLMKRVCGDR